MNIITKFSTILKLKAYTLKVLVENVLILNNSRLFSFVRNMFEDPSGCLNLQIVLNPIYSMLFSLNIHTDNKV